MKQRTLIKDLPVSPSGAAQKLWRVTDGDSAHYVVTSAVYAMFSGPETYVFPADDNGVITDWGELEGSFQGALDHERAIAGYCAGAGEE